MAENDARLASSQMYESVNSLPPAKRYIITHNEEGKSTVHSSPVLQYYGYPGIGGTSRSCTFLLISCRIPLLDFRREETTSGNYIRSIISRCTNTNPSTRRYIIRPSFPPKRPRYLCLHFHRRGIKLHRSQHRSQWIWLPPHRLRPRSWSSQHDAPHCIHRLHNLYSWPCSYGD